MTGFLFAVVTAWLVLYLLIGAVRLVDKLKAFLGGGAPVSSSQPPPPRNTL